MPQNILVIEDDKYIRDDIVTLIEEEGFIADALPNGKLMLETIASKCYDVVLCDIMMPGKDGYELLNMLRKNLTPLEIPPFIFLTAKSDKIDRRKGMELGAADYITKPFHLQEVVKAINAQIVKRQGLVNVDENKQIGKSEVAANTEINATVGNLILNYEESIFIDSSTNNRMLKLKDITHIHVEGDYTSVYTSDSKKFYLRKTLSNWEKSLPHEKFIRVRRNVIINVDYIQKIEKWFNYAYRVHMKSVNEPFVMSQRVSRELRKKIK